MIGHHNTPHTHSNQITKLQLKSDHACRIGCPVIKVCLDICKWTNCSRANSESYSGANSEATFDTQTQLRHTYSRLPSRSVLITPLAWNTEKSSTQTNKQWFTTFVGSEQLAVMSKGVVQYKLT